MVIIYCIVVFVNILSYTSCESDITQQKSKEQTERSTASDFWKNHRYSAISREGKSNNEPFFSEPNNNDQYESLPNTIQITAIPGKFNSGPVAGVLPAGINAIPGQFPGQFGYGGFGGGLGGLGLGGYGGLGGLGGVGGIGGYGGVHGVPAYHHHPQLAHGGHRPIYLINKRVDWFSWFIPLLFLLGAPLLLGIVLIPVVLKSIIFLLQILRNLGILLPITAALSGSSAATLSSQTG